MARAKARIFLVLISLAKVLKFLINQNSFSHSCISVAFIKMSNIIDNELWNISNVKLMNREKFTRVREVRFTVLYKTCNFTISGETSLKATGVYVTRKELCSIPVDFEFSLILRELSSIPHLVFILIEFCVRFSPRLSVGLS